ncbi:hypothetical protein Tco_0262157 [Tanacetum coccineum]
MNSVVDLMKEGEVKEKVVEEVKEKATKGCLDILSKVDELKPALVLAKKANDMHVGEVCAENAILATKLNELKLRFFTMSDELLLNALMNALRSELSEGLWHLLKQKLCYSFKNLPYVIDQSKLDQSPASSIFRATEQVLQPYHRIMPHLTGLNLHPGLVITMINGQNPTQEAFKMVLENLRKL